MKYGTQILIMRAANRITQKELSQKASIRLDRMIDFERNQALPTPEQKERIAIALNWPPEELAEIAFAILEGTARTPDVIAAMLDGTASFGGVA